MFEFSDNIAEEILVFIYQLLMIYRYFSNLHSKYL